MKNGIFAPSRCLVLVRWPFFAGEDIGPSLRDGPYPSQFAEICNCLACRAVRDVVPLRQSFLARDGAVRFEVTGLDLSDEFQCDGLVRVEGARRSWCFLWPDVSAMA